MQAEREPIKNVQGQQTYNLILDAAGKLFAALGYDGVSIRDIAYESGVGLSSIIYHFKSKENIYIECVKRFTLDSLKLEPLLAPLFALDGSDPQLVSDTLRDVYRNFLAAFHGKKKVEYLNGLYVSIITGGNPEALMIVIQCYAEVHVQFPIWISKICPEWNELQIASWIQLFWSQLQYTVAGKQLILHALGSELDDFPEEYIDTSAWSFAYYSALPLGLPAPNQFNK